jgi:hypothetical protein
LKKRMRKLIDEDEEIYGKLIKEGEEILCIWIVERGFVWVFYGSVNVGF